MDNRTISIDNLIEVAKEHFSNDNGISRQMIGIVEELAEKAYNEKFGYHYYKCPHCDRWFKSTRRHKMTREEAIKQLEFDIAMYKFDPTTGEEYEEYRLNEETQKTIQAEKMAIEVLEQEPCEDAISREEALLCCTGQVDTEATFEDAIAMITKRLKKLPSVTPITVRSECEDAISRAEVNAIIDDIIAENEAHEARISWHDNEAPRKYETSERCERVNPNNPAKNTAMKYGYIADGAEKVKKRIANLSSVTPIRPKGNWVKVDGDESVSLDEYKCSCCGGIHSVLSDWKYCPNCGAEMKGEE